MSHRARRDGKEGRQSWRYGKSSSKASASKKPLFAFLTVLLLVSVGLFWWSTRRTPNRNFHLAIIKVRPNSRVWTTPFADNDVQHLRDVEILRTGDLWTDVPDAEHFADQVGPKAEALLSEPYDNLLLYINAPGISDNGTAYLTLNNFSTSGADFERRQAVSELLKKVAAAGEGVKLIVLDSTSVAVDPRLGLVVNEFVHLVEADVIGLEKDSNLFVLLPSGPFQVSQTAYGDRQSLFGKYLAEGLAGAADHDEDLFVTLYELYEHVRIGCATSIDSSTGVRQTPVLLKAGFGYVPPTDALDTEQLRLTALKGRAPAPAEEPVEASEEEEADTSPDEQVGKTAWRSWPARQSPALAWMQTTAETKQPADADKTRAAQASPAKEPPEKTPATSGLQTEPAPAEPAPAEPAPAAPAKLTPQQQLLSRLEKAWGLRDSIQDPNTHDVTPMTFAPHLWRDLEAELLFVEWRILADPVFDASAPTAEEGEAPPLVRSKENEQAIEDLEDLISALEKLADAMSSKSSSSTTDARRTRLFAAWNRYIGEHLAADARFRVRQAPEAVQLRDQARNLDVLVYSLPYYVRWHARAHQSLPPTSNEHLLLEAFLDETVGLAQRLSKLRETPKLSYSQRDTIEQISRDVSEASSKRSTLDKALWDDDRSNPLVAERLLSTPLLDAERRMQLVEDLVQRKPDEASGGDVEKARQDLSATFTQWNRLHAHCQLELRLLQLALGQDDVDVQSLAAELSSADKLPAVDGSEGELWKTYQRVGALFGRCLKKTAVDATAAGDYGLHIVDYGDVPRNIGLDARQLLPPRWEYEPEVQVKIAAEQNRTDFELKTDEIRKLVLTVRATRKEHATQPLKMQIDRDLLHVESVTSGPLEKKSGWFEQAIVYNVRAKEGVTQLTGIKTTDVAVWSDGSFEADDRLRLKFTLPRPDQISLEVVRLSTRSKTPQQEQDSSLTLRVFPANLPKPALTEFQFSARNESGEKRKIEADLYLVKRGRNAKSTDGTISSERRRSLFREPANSLDLNQLQLVAQAAVEVAVDKSEVLHFKAPGASPPPEAPPATPPATPAEKPPPLDAGHGMVCRLKDESGAQWIKWIEIEPAPLHVYAAAKVWYESGRVVVEVTGRPDRYNHFPVDGLTLNWDTKPDFPKGTKRRIDAVIMQPGDADKARLYIDVEPDSITREVYIAVNGCPRVLSFRIACRESDERIDGEETRIHRKSIAITKLSIPARKQVFHVPASPSQGEQNIYLDGPPPGAKPAEGEVFLDRLEPVIVAMPVDKLLVHFHLDAPGVGLRTKRGGAVELFVDGAGSDDEPIGNAFSDRYLRTHLSGVGDNGVIQLGMRMQEQFIEIEPRDRDEELRLVGKLTVDNRTPDWSEAIPIIFDGTEPVIEKVVVPAQIDLEKKQVVGVEVDELSGISEVRYWFSPTRQPAKKPIIAALLGPPERQGQTLRLRFNVDTGGIDEGDYFLGVQVDDLVNLTSRAVYESIRIKKKVKVPVFVKISGVVKFSSVGDRLFTSVQLLTPDGEPIPGFAPQEPNPAYAFERVPEGEYLVRANFARSGKTKVDQKAIKVEKLGDLEINLKPK